MSSLIIIRSEHAMTENLDLHNPLSDPCHLYGLCAGNSGLQIWSWHNVLPWLAPDSCGCAMGAHWCRDDSIEAIRSESRMTEQNNISKKF